MDDSPPKKPNTKKHQQSRQQESGVRLTLFGKRLAWIWIVVALILVLGIVTFLYITYARHRKRVKRMAQKLRLEDANNAPTCRIPVRTKDSVAGEMDASRRVVIQQMRSMPLRFTSAFRGRRNSLVKPEDEWDGRSGIEWIQAKKAKLAKSPPKLSHKSRKEYQLEPLQYQRDAPLFVQNWTGTAGVFDIFAQIESTKNAFRNGACPLNPPPMDMQLPFDIDHQKFCRRLDAQYSHKTWWK